MAAELQDDGRIAIAEAVAAMTIHIAYGRGMPEWDGMPTPPAGSANKKLLDEIGRRLATEKIFVTPDDMGGIATPGGQRYAVSPTPTRWLMVRTTFEYGEAAEAPIREMGVFLGAQVVAEVPPGQYYVTPEQLVGPGRCYTVERRKVVERPLNKADMESVILPF